MALLTGTLLRESISPRVPLVLTPSKVREGKAWGQGPGLKKHLVVRLGFCLSFQALKCSQNFKRLWGSFGRSGLRV